MTNKEQINKIKNNAELAWAAYGYFHLANKSYNPDSGKDKDKLDYFRKGNLNKENSHPTLTNILNIDYQYYIDEKTGKVTNDKFLGGDFTPNQAKRFFEKYDLLDFYPKDNSKGFHACLFQDKQTKEFTLAMRGSLDSSDYVTDVINLFASSTIPFDYFHKMILFYESCAKKYPEITKPKSLNVVGHSLGGCLAQMFALAFSDNNTNKDSIINEVYTFNSPGAKNLRPNIIIDESKIYEVDENIIKYSNPADAMLNKITRGGSKTGKSMGSRQHIGFEHGILAELQNHFSKIPSDELKPHDIFLYDYNTDRDRGGINTYRIYSITDTFLTSYETLIHNYDNRKKRDYKLSISDRIFHIESQNKADEEHHANEFATKNAIQHLGKDIEGNYFLLILTLGD